MGGGVVGSVPGLADQVASLVGIPPRNEDELGPLSDTRKKRIQINTTLFVIELNSC